MANYVVIPLILLLLTSVNNAHADMYETHSSPLDSNPTVCILEPEPEYQRIFYSYLLVQTFDSIHHWQNALLDYSHGNWNIDTKVISFEEHTHKKVSDFPKCNIFFTYSGYSGSKRLGMTQIDHSNSAHKYDIITIFTETSLYNTSGICIKCTNQTVISPHIKIPPNGIKAIIDHEFGHALGLGHYLQTQSHGAKSIMLPYINPFSKEQPTIEAVDLEALVTLYNTDGFGGKEGFVARYIPVSDLLDKIMLNNTKT